MTVQLHTLLNNILKHILILIPVFSVAQYDTIVDMGIYKSYFSKQKHEPVAVTYTLYHGGGPADRKNDRFKWTSLTLNDASYRHSGYDRGHLVPAEDFAFSDSLQAITFSYYNCVPQAPDLNRGQWKRYEAQVRKLSQKDTIFVVCYNEFSESWVPDACYKLVYDMRGNLLLNIGFKNDSAHLALTVPKYIYEFVKTVK